MKTRKIFPLLLILLAMAALFSTPVFPRAGAGHKYRPIQRPSRRNTSNRATNTFTRRTSNTQWGSTGARTYTSTTSTYMGGTSQTKGDAKSGTTCCLGMSTCGVVMVIVFIAVIVLIILALTKKKKSAVKGGENIAGEGAPLKIHTIEEDDLKPIDEELVKQQLAQLKEKDPYFSEKVFIDKAQTTFFEIQRAWSRQDMEPVRKFMSEAQYNRMNIQLSEYTDKGWVNKVEDLVIGKVYMAEAGIEGEFDFIKTRIHCSMSDKTYDKDGNIVEGGKEIIPVVEYWTFIRKQGAKTNQDGGRTVSHNCPNCGAPIETGESGKCPYCDAVITAASFDWVLDTIVQPQEEMG